MPFLLALPTVKLSKEQVCLVICFSSKSTLRYPGFTAVPLPLPLILDFLSPAKPITMYWSHIKWWHHFLDLFSEEHVSDYFRPLIQQLWLGSHYAILIPGCHHCSLVLFMHLHIRQVAHTHIHTYSLFLISSFVRLASCDWHSHHCTCKYRHSFIVAWCYFGSRHLRNNNVGCSHSHAAVWYSHTHLTYTHQNPSTNFHVYSWFLQMFIGRIFIYPVKFVVFISVIYEF